MRLLNACGCLDALTSPEIARSLDAFVSKTVTPLPREGNAPVRIAETDVGMLNSIGLANPGRDAFLSETLPQLRKLGVPVWISVGGFTADEYAETCARLEDVTIELNLSCPNVEEAADTAASIVAACRAATSLTLYAKLSPANWHMSEVARAVQAACADGLSLVNTIRGTALDERTLEPRLGTWSGGLSGPALKPVAAGAQDVALGTVLFRDPDATERVRSELAAELAALGVADVDIVRGVAHEGGLAPVLSTSQ